MTPSSALEADVLDTLRDRFSGQLIIATDGGYDDARAIFNGMIDKRPTLIARCSSTDDVVAAILFAREHDLPWPSVAAATRRPATRAATTGS